MKMPKEKLLQEYTMVLEVFEAYNIRKNIIVDKKQMSIVGSFRKEDIERMKKDQDFYMENYRILMNDWLFAEKLRKSYIDGRPWWYSGELTNSKSKGLAAYKYTGIENKGNARNASEYVLDEKEPWKNIYVTEDAIHIGIDIEKHKGATLVNCESVMLASQQLGIQKWGSIKLNGDKIFIEESLKVAIKNGTWQNISNPELQKRISKDVMKEAGVTEIWKLFSNESLSSSATANETESLLFSTVQNAIYVLNRDIKDFPEEEQNAVFDCIVTLNTFQYKVPGDFFNGIIEKQHDPANEFSNNINDLFKIIKKHPEVLESIQSHAVQKALGHGCIEPTAPIRIGNALLDANNMYKKSSSFAVICHSLGVKPEPELVKEKLVALKTGLSEIEKKVVTSVDHEKENEKIQEFVKFINEFENKTNRSVFTDAIFTESSQELVSTSIVIQKMREYFRKHHVESGIPEYSELYFMNEDFSKEHERLKINNPVPEEEMKSFMISKQKEEYTIGGRTCLLEYTETAQGPTLFFKEVHESGVTDIIGMMNTKGIISEQPNNDLGKSFMEEIADVVFQDFGSCDRLFTTEQEMEKASKARADMDVKAETKDTLGVPAEKISETLQERASTEELPDASKMKQSSSPTGSKM